MMGLMAVALAALLATGARADVIRVCPEGATAANCRYIGDRAIQAAIDVAKDGDTIQIARGRYVPRATRDIAFQDLALRGHVVIKGKTLVIRGEDGAVLDGAAGVPSIAFVIANGDVTFDNLEISGFRYADPEDKVYDGHGIFAVDSRLTLSRVTMRHIIKMAITGRGDSLIDATDVSLLDGHLGVWLEESAHARLRNMVIRGGDSAAVAAYMNSSATLSNSVIERNTDDGIYAKDSASIFVTNSLVLGNAPFGINAVDDARITVAHSVLHGNATDLSSTTNQGQIRAGQGIIKADPQVDADYRPQPGSPLLGKVDPDLKRPIGLISSALN